MSDDTNKLLKQILTELQAIRRNQEAIMPMSVVEGIKRGRVEEAQQMQPPESEAERVERRKASLASKG